MQAKFHRDGKLEIFNGQGEVIVSGVPDAAQGEFGFHPMMDYAVALVKHKGDWPEKPWQGQTVKLEDESTIRAGP